MRCFYCGKELALLKRLIGVGRFCSNAHRDLFREEYNQLALKRLLQAMPPSASELVAAATGGDESVPSSPVQPPLVGSRDITAEPAGLFIGKFCLNVHRPVDDEDHNQLAVKRLLRARLLDEPAPAEPAGFFFERPIAIELNPPTALKAETGPEICTTVSLPSFQAEALGTLLAEPEAASPNAILPAVVETGLKERDRLNRAIETPQATSRRGRVPRSSVKKISASPKRKGRTFTAAQRKEVSERMKAYWAQRAKMKSLAAGLPCSIDDEANDRSLVFA